MREPVLQLISPKRWFGPCAIMCLWLLAAYPVIAQDIPPAINTILDIRQKAEKGDAKAQYQLGYAYHFNMGVLKDDRKAIEWWKKSADQGYAPAQVYMSSAYDQGWGVSTDSARSLEWLNKAMARGSADAQFLMAVNYAFGYHGLAIDRERADELWKQALEPLRSGAKTGDTEAQLDLGTMYSKGWFVPQDRAEAFKWRLAAAKAGHPIGALTTALHYHNGEGARKDPKEAAKWFSVAADHGETMAQKFLAEAYASGSGVAKDNLKAYEWFNTALALGNTSVISSMAEIGKELSPEQAKQAIAASETWQKQHVAGKMSQPHL